MDLHRVRRLTTVLFASELRSGRSSSNPKSLFGRPAAIGLIDLAAFLAAYGLAASVLRVVGATDPSVVALVGAPLLLLLPILAVAVVLVAGVMFEFSSSSRFASSDAVNWLPVSPSEFVVASSLAVAFLYSTAVALALGVGLAASLALGLLPVYLLSAGLSVVALFEGGVLMEMLRAVAQRATAALAGRRGKFTLVGRALLFIVVVLLFELGFNPVLLVALLGVLTRFGEVASVVPLFWSTRAVLYALDGAPALVALFSAAQLAFVAGLVALAGRVRVRFWAPASPEVRLEAHAYGRGHPWLALVGLSDAETAIASKDLSGLFRRREMLPMAVMPLVLALLGFLQASPVGGGTLNATTITLWVAWIPGFAALICAVTSIGQERRAILTLYAAPISWRNVFRAKLLVPLAFAGLVLAGMWLAVAVVYRLPGLPLVTIGVTAVDTILLGTFVGLAFGTRFADFQERPRAQFVRPGAMAAAMLGGIGLIFAVVVPALLWMFSPQPFQGGHLAPILASGVLAAVATVAAYLLARSGTRKLLGEFPA